MIKGVFIINNHGQCRCAKFYDDWVAEAHKQGVIREIFSNVSKRGDSLCNFLDGSQIQTSNKAWAKNCRLVYRHYATLYFIFLVEETESELGILDLIQVFVESLDKVFENVCELDLIFHADKVHHVLDEVVMGGMVLETNMHEILTAVGDMSKLEKAVPPRAGGVKKR